MPRTIIRTASLLAVISVLIPLVVIFVINLVAIYLGVGQQWVFIFSLASIPLIWLYFSRRIGPKLTGITVNKRKDWERLALVLTLIFTVIAAMFTVQSFYGQTVTQSTCGNPSNVNVTSPNCKVIETVSIPQSAIMGPWATLLLDVILLMIAVFGVWTAVLYVYPKAFE